MNMKSLIARHLALMIVTFLACFVSLYAKSPTSEEITKRVKSLNTVIDVKVTDEVINEILTRVTKHRQESESILGRTTLYFPMIEHQLRKYGLPDEIKYLPIIESSLLPTLESRKGAAGLWQIMEKTGRTFGLSVDKYFDDRKDVEKSTIAAIKYLSVMYNLYGDWTMALAAYNCGEGNVNKAIKKSGGKTTYWEIHKHLPLETQKFIPRFLGIAYLMNHYYLHDLSPREPEDYFKYPLTIKVFEKVDLKKLANELDLSLYTIKILNPIYRKDIIPAPKGDSYHTLTLPDLSMAVYLTKYNSIDNIINKPFVLTRSNSLTNIPLAEVSLKDFGQLGFASLKPVKNSFDLTILQKIEDKMKISTAPVTLYRMRRKESLSDIALRYNVSLDELIQLNNINPKEGINPGTIIILPDIKT